MKKKHILILSFVFVILLTLTFYFIFSKNKNDSMVKPEIKVEEKTKQLSDEHKNQNFSIKDLKINNEGENSVLSFVIYNINNEREYLPSSYILLKFKDDKGSIVQEAVIDLPMIAADESVEIIKMLNYKLDNVSDYEFDEDVHVEGMG